MFYQFISSIYIYQIAEIGAYRRNKLCAWIEGSEKISKANMFEITYTGKMVGN